MRRAGRETNGGKSFAGDTRGPLRVGLAFANTAVAAFALLKFHQSFQEPGAVEVRPERLGHKNLRVGDLPKQEIAQAHLAAGSNQQVRVRQATGIQMPRELLLSDLRRRSISISLVRYLRKSCMWKSISVFGRRQFSTENAQSVSASIFNRAQVSMDVRADYAPERCPAILSKCRFCAQRPLPSMMTATWRGQR